MTNSIKLSEFISIIKNNDLLLPDFQRNFVWSKDDMKRISDMDYSKYSTDPKILNSLSQVRCNPDSFNCNNVQSFLKGRFNDLNARLGKYLSYLKIKADKLGK